MADATSSAGNLQQMFPQMNWQQSYDFEGQDPMGFGQAMQAMQDLGDLDQLENLLRNASNPGALAEADMDRVRDLMGDDAAKSLERLAELTKMLEEAGPDRAEGRPARADAEGSAARSGRTRCATCSPSWPRTRSASTRRASSGQGHERTYETKPYEYGDPFQLDLHRTIRNALRRTGGGTPVHPRTPTTSRSSAPSTSPGRRRC